MLLHANCSENIALRVTRRWFHLHHVGTPVGKHSTARWPSNPNAEFYYFDSSKWPWSHHFPLFADVITFIMSLLPV